MSVISVILLALCSIVYVSLRASLCLFVLFLFVSLHVFLSLSVSFLFLFPSP